MAFGKLPGESDDQPLCEINMIPMIDVMLVLLIVFMITAPLLTNAVKLELPEASSQANQPRQEDVVLSIDGAGKIYWNAKEVDEATLLTRMSEAGQARGSRDPAAHRQARGVRRHRPGDGPGLPAGPAQDRLRQPARGRVTATQRARHHPGGALLVFRLDPEVARDGQALHDAKPARHHGAARHVKERA